jgi:solute carrier family 35 (UDP-galactose transporter), member B1
MLSEIAKKKFKCLAFAIGIIVSYSIYGVLHEKITKPRYGKELQEDGKFGEKFTFAVAYVALQTIVFTVFAKSE